MEYAEGGDLSSYLIQKNHLNEEEARKIFQQLIDCIYYFHQIGICHRNLKLENILFSSKKRDKIKIINFGHSNLYLTGVNSDNPTLSFGAEFLETPYGSKAYTPPEIILGIKYDGLLLDIWHCGIILYTLLFGSFPFQDKNVDNLYTKIIKGDFKYPKNIIISEDAHLLLNKILVVNPRLRSDINNIKKDVWFLKDYNPIFGLYISIRDIPISNKIIEEMEKYGFKKSEIIKNIKNNRHNNITSFYYILVNKLRKEGIETISDLISEGFIEYLREQDLKFNLIKKGEKPISLKLMKSKSKSLFDLNDINNNDLYQNVDLDYLKKIFQDYNSEDKSKIENKNNKDKIKNKNDKKNKKNNKVIKEQKKSKSQNSKRIDKKFNNIKKDRYSYSTSLNKKNKKKIKEENKMKLLYKNKNTKISKDEKNNNKNKQIINIKELIKVNNKNIINNDSKKLVKEEPKLNQNQNLVINATTSFCKNKKNSLIINKNILNNNNDSSTRLNKIKDMKEKYTKNYNIKNLSLKNKYTQEKKYGGFITSRNYFGTDLYKENKTSRNINHRYLINSTSNSKSKSLKSKSNYSSEKGETIFCKNDSKKKKKKNYLNIKINILKHSSLSKDKKNISKNNSLKEKKKLKEAKSNSAPKQKDNRDKNKYLNKHKRFKNSLYVMNKSKEKDKLLKNEIISDNYNNSKDKLNNNKKINNKLKNQIIKNKERIKAHLNSINNIERHFTEINNENKNDSSKKTINDKHFSNTLKKLIPKKKGISPKENSLNKKSLNTLINRVFPNLSKKNEIRKIIKNESKKNQNTYTNSTIQTRRKISNRITNIRRTSPQNERNKKNDNLNKAKIKEIKSIKIFNIPKNESFFKAEQLSENRRSLNHLNKFYQIDGKIQHKNRMVLNAKKFNNI